MAKTRSNSSGVISEMCPNVSTPELEITMSMCLKCAWAFSKRVTMSAGFEMSAAIAMAERPRDSISLTTC